MEGTTPHALQKEVLPRSTGGRRAHPLRSHGVLAAAVGVVYGALLLFNVVVSLGAPRLSVVVAVPAAGMARVDWVRPGSTPWERGVRAGTPVLALDGRRPAPRDAGPWVGQRLQVLLPASGPTTISALSIGTNRVTWPLLVLSPWFFLLGTLVLLRSPRIDVGRATYLLCAVAAAALALAPAAIGDIPFAAAVEFAAVTLFPACFVTFCLTFPVRRGGVLSRTLVFALPVAAILLYLVALVVLPVLYTVAALLRLAILLVYLLMGVAFLVRSFVADRDRETRQGLVIIGAGAAASVLPFLILYVAPALVHQSALLAPETAILGLALLPLALTYAILRHRALDVRLLQRWLVHGLLGAGFVALFAAVVSTRNWYLGDVPEPGRSLILSSVLGLLAVVLFGQLYGRARALLDRLIFKDLYEYREALYVVSQDLMAAGDVDGVGVALTGSIRRLMNLDFAVLLVRNGEESVVVAGQAGAGDSSLLAALAATVRGDDGADGPHLEVLDSHDLRVMLVPLRTHDATVGHLCLGPKASGEPYGGDDRALVATLSGHLAAVVRNIQLVAALRTTIDDLHAQRKTVELLNAALEQTREQERARLAADLHDEPLQTALDIQRHLAAATRPDSPLVTIQSARLQTLIDQLRALCIRMRPAALDQLGLHAALDMLAMDVSERYDVSIGLSPRTEMDGVFLAPAIELVLYRAAQEALTNSVRHGRPRAIMMTLQRCGATMRLSVSDDGVGFIVPARLDDLVEHGHLGIVGLQQRLRYCGGQMEVSSTPGGGTLVHVDVPLEIYERASV